MKRFFAIAGVVAAMVVASLVSAPQPEATASSSPAGTAPAGNWSAPGSGAAGATGTLFGGAPAQPSKPAVAPKSAAPKSAGASRLPARALTGKFIEISIASQTLTAWQDGVAKMTFKISTGRPGYRTPKGEFRVRAKGVKWWSRKWKVWMPYAMNFYSNYNMHSLPYSRPGHLIGAKRLGRPDSHGCVRIGPANAKALYAWTPVGTSVWIH